MAQFRQLSIAVVSMFFSVEAVLDFVEWVEAGTGEGGTQLPALLLIGLAFGCASCQGEKQDKARIVFLLGYIPTFIVRRRTGPTLGLMRAREGGGFWQS